MAWDGLEGNLAPPCALPHLAHWTAATRPDLCDVSHAEVCAISLQQGTQSILALGGEIIPQERVEKSRVPTAQDAQVWEISQLLFEHSIEESKSNSIVRSSAWLLRIKH